MKEICAYREITEKPTDPPVTSGIHFFCEEKQVVLNYLKQHEPEVVQAHAMKDYVNGHNLIESVECFTDGEYFWTNEETYLFEKYDLKLNDDFIEYVLNRP